MTLARIVRPLAAALLVLSLLPSTSAAQPGVYDSFYVFGDSLADNGNVWLSAKAAGPSVFNPAPPPSESPNLTYYAGRFSNGPVAFEYLWHGLSGHAPNSVGGLRPFVSCTALTPCGKAINFAFGGTGTPESDLTPGGFPAPGLKGQVALFRQSVPVVSGRALAAIVTGANDYRADQFNVPMDPTEVVANIGESVQALYASGVRNFIVLTLPDLGKLPYLSAAEAKAGSKLARTHNDKLAAQMKVVAKTLPGINLRLIDVNVVFGLLREVIAAQPAPPGLPFPLWALPALDTALPTFNAPGTGAPTPMSACLFVAPSECADWPLTRADGTMPTSFPLLFWDVVHPTTHAHKTLATYILLRLLGLP